MWRIYFPLISAIFFQVAPGAARASILELSGIPGTWQYLMSYYKTEAAKAWVDPKTGISWEKSGVFFAETERDDNRGIVRITRLHVLYDIKKKGGQSAYYHAHIVDLQQLRAGKTIMENSGYRVVTLKSDGFGDQGGKVRIKFLATVGQGGGPYYDDRLVIDINVENGKVIAKRQSKYFNILALKPHFKFIAAKMSEVEVGVERVIFCHYSCKSGQLKGADHVTEN
jgi:hypothetical protein